MKALLFSFAAFIILASSCQKTGYIESKDALIGISADSLRFDTVFTSTGSVTQFFRIYNPNQQTLKIGKIALAGGNNSAFKMNVDGMPGSNVTDIEIAANDSVYVFVTVKINPTFANLPFVYRDSLSLSYNGNTKWVQLEAWGQNAHFFRNKTMLTDEIWTNDKPYVILGGLVVSPGKTLTIEKGCRIHLHGDAPLIINGTLKVKGEKEGLNRVYFSTDRLDDPYSDYPASWPGIFFGPSSFNNELTYSIIRNAYQGIVTEGGSGNLNPKLSLNQCIIDNCYDAGIIAVNSSVDAVNCLLSNNGKNTVLLKGGTYHFTHCTSVAYSTAYFPHKEAVLQITDFVKSSTGLLTAPLLAGFTNCIFWGDNGSVVNEVETLKQGTGTFNVQFTNCLWRVKDLPANTTNTGVINNQSPLFDSVNTTIRYFDFHLKGNSPAKGKAGSSFVGIDLDGNLRPLGLPDMGCYERQ